MKVSDDAKAALFGADQAVAAGDYATASQRFQELLDLEDEGLIEFGTRTWLAAPDVARRRLLAMDEVGRNRYRELFAESAAAAWVRAKATRDSRNLRAVARRFPLAAIAIPALRDALALAAESGAAVEVRRAAALLAELGPLRAIDYARVAATLAADGDSKGLLALRERSAALANESIRVEGRESTLGTFVDSLISQFASPPEFDFARAPLSLVPIGMLTSAEFHLDEQAQDPTNGNPLRDLEVFAPGALFATKRGERYEVAGRYGVYSFNGLAADDPRSPDFQYSRLFGLDTPQVDIVSRALEPAFDGETMHLSITRRLGFGFDASDLDNVLFALTLDAEGGPRVEWKWEGPPQQDEAIEGYVFVSPPAFHRDLVLYSASRQKAASECSVFAFDRRSGELRWSRFVTSASEIAEFDERNQPTETRRVIPSPVVVRDGVAYVVTNLGIVCALDAGTGAIEWCFKYNRMSPTDVDRYRKVQFYDTGGWLPAAPIVTTDRLIVTPEDSRFLYVLAREPGPDGSIVLNDPFHKLERVALIGYDEPRQRLLFEARHVVRANVDGIMFQATDLSGVSRDGQGWTTLKFENEEQRVGRCAVRGDLLVIPTTKRLVFVDLAHDGRLTRQVLPPRSSIEQNERRYFGNLTFCGDELVSSSPRFVVALRKQ